MTNRNQTTGWAGNLRASFLSTVPTRFFDGEGGAGGGDINLEDPKIVEAITAAVEAATAGLKTNNQKLLDEKKTLQTQFTDFSKQWEGMDPKVVKSLVDRFKNDEEAKLIAEGKIDDVINGRVSAMSKDFETRLGAATGRTSELEKALEERTATIRDLKLEGHLSKAAASLGVLPSALEDAVVRARAVFALDDNGQLIARDGSGALLLGKNGKDSLSTAEWLEAMKEKAPHWFTPPTGAGAGGGSGRGGAGKGYSISREDARNPQKYQAAKAAAKEAGQELQIVD